MKFKSLALAAIMALSLPMVSRAADIATEDALSDLSVIIVADLVEGYKVTLSNASMTAASVQMGTIQLTPSSLLPAKSLAAAACKDSADVLISYAGGVSCAIVAGPLASASDSHAQFVADFSYKVDLAGPGSIDVHASLLGKGISNSAFTDSLIKFDADVLAATAAINGKLDTAAGSFQWSGKMPLNQGPTFEETIALDVIKN